MIFLVFIMRLRLLIEFEKCHAGSLVQYVFCVVECGPWWPWLWYCLIVKLDNGHCCFIAERRYKENLWFM